MLTKQTRRKITMTKLQDLQKQLNNMPLVALNPAMRKKRDKVQRQLMEEARRTGQVSSVNLIGARGMY